MQIVGGSLSDVESRIARLDFASFGPVKLKRVAFRRGCQMREADFSQTALDRVLFAECDLTRATFSRTQIVRCEMRRCDLSGLRGLGELRGVAMERNDLARAGRSVRGGTRNRGASRGRLTPFSAPRRVARLRTVRAGAGA